jgi:hypothetical protein
VPICPELLYILHASISFMLVCLACLCVLDPLVSAYMCVLHECVSCMNVCPAGQCVLKDCVLKDCVFCTPRCPSCHLPFLCFLNASRSYMPMCPASCLSCMTVCQKSNVSCLLMCTLCLYLLHYCVTCMPVCPALQY